MEREFPNIVFDESFVTGITLAQTIRIEVEFLLLPEHEKYHEPKKGHRACFVEGALVFENATSVSVKNDGPISTYDANNEIDFDCIYAFQEIEGRYLLSFGLERLEFNSDRPRIEWREASK